MIIRCGVNHKCPHPALFRLKVAGSKAGLRAPVDSCAVHLSTIARDFTSVSNDIRLKGIDRP